MSNELTTYNEAVDLVAVRMDSARFPRIKTIPATTAVTGMSQIIGATMAYSGKSLSTEDLERMAATLLNELLQDYDGIGTANITLHEINYCVRRAVLGLGPEMYGINVASLYKVICDYCLHEGRQAQESANNRNRQQRQAALKKSAVGAMLESYAGRTINTSKK